MGEMSGAKSEGCFFLLKSERKCVSRLPLIKLICKISLASATSFILYSHKSKASL